MGFVESMKDFFSRTNRGFDEYEDYEDIEEEEIEEPTEQRGKFNRYYTPPVVPKREKIVPFEPERRSNTTESSEINVIKVKSFAEAETVADTLKTGSAVIIDVSEMEDNGEAKSVVDFISGVACGIGGSHKRITPGIFITTPANIAIRIEENPRSGKGRWDMNRN